MAQAFSTTFVTDIGGLFDFQPAGLDFGEIEDVIDDLSKAMPLRGSSAISAW